MLFYVSIVIKCEISHGLLHMSRNQLPLIFNDMQLVTNNTELSIILSVTYVRFNICFGTFLRLL